MILTVQVDASNALERASLLVSSTFTSAGYLFNILRQQSPVSAAIVHYHNLIPHTPKAVYQGQICSANTESCRPQTSPDHSLV